MTKPGGYFYSTQISLGKPKVGGTASSSSSFPSGFPDSLTDYCGTYELAFNKSLATGQFTVNILDSSSYHRGETVNINAVGYQANQGATITVTSGSTVVDTKTAYGDENGAISTIWVAPNDDQIGELTLKISTTGGTIKSLADQQTFAIVGYNVKVEVTNLSGKGVSGISVKATDAQTQTSRSCSR